MKKILRFALIVVATVGLQPCSAQDIHHLPVEVTPLTLDPAFTGAFDGGLRVSALHREQFEAMLPLSVIDLSADGKLFTAPGGHYLGGGIHITKDWSEHFDNIGAYASLAYHFVLLRDTAANRNKMELSGGLQLGCTQRNYNFSAEYLGTFPDLFHAMWPYYGDYLPLSYFPLNIGFSFAHATSRHFSYTLGISINNINNSFFPSDPINWWSNIRTNMDAYKYFIGGANWKVSERVSLKPAVVYASLDVKNAIVCGTDITYTTKQTMFSATEGTTLFAGAWLRSGGVISATAGNEYKGLKVGAAYDIVYDSPYNNLQYDGWAFELFARYTTPGSRKKRSVACSRF
jgi:hypothetical protein